MHYIYYTSQVYFSYDYIVMYICVYYMLLCTLKTTCIYVYYMCYILCDDILEIKNFFFTPKHRIILFKQQTNTHYYGFKRRV
jgi:hypothetical protein